jgi:hypothetical protein
MFSMQLSRLRTVVLRVMVVAMGRVSVVCSLLVIAGLVVFCRAFVVVCRFLVVVGCLAMMLCRFFGQDSLPS